MPKRTRESNSYSEIDFYPILIDAIIRNDIGLVDYLVNNLGIDTNVILTKDKCPLVLYALKHRKFNRSMIKYLLTLPDINLNIKDRTGGSIKSIIYHRYYGYDEDILFKLISHPNIIIDFKQDTLNHIFRLACTNKKWPSHIIEKLVIAGANINIRYVGIPLLILFVRTNNYEMVEKMLNWGCNPNLMTPRGDTALSTSKNVDITNLLIANGAHYFEIEKLPFEILQYILSYVEYGSIREFRKINKNFRNIIDNDYFWKLKCFKTFNITVKQTSNWKKEYLSLAQEPAADSLIKFISELNYKDLKRILNFGVNPNTVFTYNHHLIKYSYTPLMLALLHNENEISDMLIHAGARLPNLLILGKTNILMHLANYFNKNGFTFNIDTYLSRILNYKPDIDINIKDEDGCTPIMNAYKYIHIKGRCHSNLLDILLSKRPNINIQNNSGDTLLSCIIKQMNDYHPCKDGMKVKATKRICYFKQKSLKYIKWLIENPDIDLNVKNNDGYTPLMLALLHNIPIDLLQQLICNPKIDLDIENNKGETALFIAILYEKWMEVSYLVSMHANVKKYKNLKLTEDDFKNKTIFDLKKMMIKKEIDLAKSYRRKPRKDHLIKAILTHRNKVLNEFNERLNLHHMIQKR